jgi:hypothetical protein
MASASRYKMFVISEKSLNYIGSSSRSIITSVDLMRAATVSPFFN